MYETQTRERRQLHTAVLFCRELTHFLFTKFKYEKCGKRQNVTNLCKRVYFNQNAIITDFNPLNTLNKEIFSSDVECS